MTFLCCELWILFFIAREETGLRCRFGGWNAMDQQKGAGQTCGTWCDIQRDLTATNTCWPWKLSKSKADEKPVCLKVCWGMSGRCPSPWQQGGNELVSKIPPAQSILWFCDAHGQKTSTRMLCLPTTLTLQFVSLQILCSAEAVQKLLFQNLTRALTFETYGILFHLLEMINFLKCFLTNFGQGFVCLCPGIRERKRKVSFQKTVSPVKAWGPYHQQVGSSQKKHSR